MSRGQNPGHLGCTEGKAIMRLKKGFEHAQIVLGRKTKFAILNRYIGILNTFELILIYIYIHTLHIS